MTSKQMTFDTQNSAHDRLAGTFCLFRNELVYVASIKADLLADVRIGVGFQSKAVCDVHELTYQGLRFGFLPIAAGLGVNTPYIARGFARQYKQGITNGQLTAYSPVGVTEQPVPDILGNKDAYEAMFVNRYPTFEQARADGQLPFSRRFTFARSRGVSKLCYKNFGVVGDKDGVLDVKFQHLREQLEQDKYVVNGS